MKRAREDWRGFDLISHAQPRPEVVLDRLGSRFRRMVFLQVDETDK